MPERKGDGRLFLTLPQVADAIGAEYRTLHSWVAKGILAPSVQAARGAGVPNLFNEQDAVKACVIAGLRHAGASLEELRQVGERLDERPEALNGGSVVLVNGSVAVIEEAAAAEAIRRSSPSLLYSTSHAVAEVSVALAGRAA